MVLIEVVNKQIHLTTFHALLNNSINPETTLGFNEWLSDVKESYEKGKISKDVIIELCEAARLYKDGLDRELVDGGSAIIVNSQLGGDGGDVRKMALCEQVMELEQIL